MYFKDEQRKSSRFVSVLLFGLALFMLFFLGCLFAQLHAVQSMRPGDVVVIGGVLHLLEAGRSAAASGASEITFAVKPGLPALFAASYVMAFGITRLARRQKLRLAKG